MKTTIIPLLIILFSATILRVYNINLNPPGLTWDEAALGYNAYSILQTGKDEYGSFLPVHLKSFGDYKPALFVYLTIPFVAILGLNELSVRLPSAIFGVLTVLFVYLLVHKLFGNKLLAIFSSFFMAISPLAIQFSRVGFEANIALFLNLLGLYLFIKGFTQKKYLIFSAITFGLSLFTYQSSRLFVPLLFLSLVIFFKKRLQNDQYSKYSIAVFGIFVAILIYLLFIVGGSSRLSTLNFFAYQRSEEVIEMISKEDGLNRSNVLFEVLHGEWWSYIRGLTERYLIYFSPKMLFIEGDYSQRHKVPDLGVLYYFSILFIPMGIIYLLRQKNDLTKIIFFYCLLAPLPAVLSRDLINMLRAYNLIIPFVIFEAAGLYYLFLVLKETKKTVFCLSFFIIGSLILFNFLVFSDRYFIHMPKEYSKYFLYGQNEAVDFINKQSKNYPKVIFTDSYGQPYIYYLFYSKYPPERFQQQAKLIQESVDVGTVRNIDNIEFRPIYWPDDRNLKNSLFIGTGEQLPDKDILPFSQFRILKEIKFKNLETAFKIVESD